MAGAAGRIAIYLREMYPPAVQLPVAALSFASVTFAFQAGAGGALLVSLRSLAGTLTVFLLLLFLRVCDELKDLDADKAHFPDRAIVRGDVLVEDLHRLHRGCLGAMVLLNLWQGPTVLAAFAGLLVYALLMERWFFMEARMRASLWLAVATHNPIVPLISLYGLAVTAADGALGSLTPGELAALIVALWSPSLAWEIARKIRAAENETDYVTYSQLMGPRTAALTVAALLALTGGLLTALRESLALPGAALIVVGSGVLLALTALVAFALNPGPKTETPLRPAVELCLGLLYLGLAGGFGIARGLRWETLP